MSTTQTSTPPLGELYFQSLLNGVASVRDRFDAATGRFIRMPAEGPKNPDRTDTIGWAVTHQDVILALAVLYTTDRLDNPHAGDANLLEMIVRGGDAIREFQNADGTVNFVKPDGSDWGPTYMCWTNYHWLEAYGLMRDHLPDDTRRGWEEGLTLAHDGQADLLVGNRIHNIPTWQATSCWRAGTLMSNERWQRIAARHIDRVIDAQHSGGFWAEHGGPTTSYNRVYWHALGLYWLFSGEPRALEAVRRAIDFHIVHSYPDGTGIETIDGRTKYDASQSPMGLVALGLTPEGRRLARCLMCSPVGQQRVDAAPHISAETVSTQTVFGATPSLAASCTPTMATACMYAQEGAEQPSLFEQRERHHNWRNRSLTLRHGPWFACCSAIVVPPTENVWGQDRQHFVSLWAQDLGLLIGGGNSRQQPAWSTFVVASPEGRRYLPGRAGLTDDGLWLDYGPTRCVLAWELSDDAATLHAHLSKAPHPTTLQLQLRLRPGVAVRCGDRQVTVSTNRMHVDKQRGTLDVGPGAWRIDVPSHWTLDWPIAPYNPYTKDGSAPIDQAVAVFSVAVPAQGSVSVTMRRGG